MTSTDRLNARMYVGPSVYLPKHAAAVATTPTASADFTARAIAASKSRQARDIEWLRAHSPARLFAVAAAHLAPVVAMVAVVGAL